MIFSRNQAVSDLIDEIINSVSGGVVPSSTPGGRGDSIPWMLTRWITSFLCKQNCQGISKGSYPILVQIEKKVKNLKKKLMEKVDKVRIVMGREDLK